MPETAKPAARTIIVHPHFSYQGGRDENAPALSAAARVEEACGLAAAIALNVVHAETVNIGKPRPATLLGQGTVARIGALAEEENAELIIVDGHLSPGQQRNLEKAWHAKVIDRTGLILEIFGARAKTKEGQLQVELAHLTYQKSRLVRSWTHLERQRGGFGFLGGPGETQIEIDRRLIGERIARLKKELEKVTRTRHLHRQARKRIPYPIVALVGYTNAGKSTLFNALTSAGVMAADLLFATLDPTMRHIKLPSGRTAILSDTVGFVSDLPHELVAAFRATLEEVLEADVIVHVRDIAHHDSEAQKHDVEEVLAQLGINGDDSEGDDSDVPRRPLIEALNKIDLLPDDERVRVANVAARSEAQAAISAVSGEGIERLLTLFDRHLSAARQPVSVTVPLEDGATLAWLYRRGEVLARHEGETAAELSVLLDAADLARLETRAGVTVRKSFEVAAE